MNLCLSSTTDAQVSQIEQTTTTANDLISCHYCDYTNSNEKEVERHSVNAHPGISARPDPDLLNMIKQQQQQQQQEQEDGEMRE